MLCRIGLWYARQAPHDRPQNGSSVKDIRSPMYRITSRHHLKSLPCHRQYTTWPCKGYRIKASYGRSCTKYGLTGATSRTTASPVPSTAATIRSWRVTADGKSLTGATGANNGLTMCYVQHDRAHADNKHPAATSEGLTGATARSPPGCLPTPAAPGRAARGGWT